MDNHCDKAQSRSLAGARIETRLYPHGGVAPQSRSLAGARIETLTRRCVRPSRWSLPRGGADRNTGRRPPRSPSTVAPSRGRGSKHPTQLVLLPISRRSLAGARIETLCGPVLASGAIVAPSRGRGSKPWIGTDPGRYRGSLPRGGADRNLPPLIELAMQSVAPSRGRGSKPRLPPERHHRHGGRSLAGARIEQLRGKPIVLACESLPRGGADRNKLSLEIGTSLDVAPSRGRGSKIGLPSGAAADHPYDCQPIYSQPRIDPSRT